LQIAEPKLMDACDNDKINLRNPLAESLFSDPGGMALPWIHSHGDKWEVLHAIWLSIGMTYV